MFHWLNLNIKGSTMIKKYSVIALALIFNFTISACSKNEPNASVQTGQSLKAKDSTSSLPNPNPPIESVVIENSSPDQAVKSWWKVIDLLEQESVDECKKNQNKAPLNHVRYFPKITQEDLLRSITPQIPDCRLTVYDREILEVKTESETRAILFAKVKNVTPIPEGAEPDEYDKKFRKEGFRFKYLIEKSSEGWKLSQVYEYDRYSTTGESWRAIYKYSDKPHFPGYVSRQ